MHGTRCCFSWYTEALPLLLCFGEEETKAGNGIRVSAEHCLSQASFLYYFILTLLYLTALSLEIRSMLFLHAVPTWCTLYVSTSAVLDVFFLLVTHSSLQTRALSALNRSPVPSVPHGEDRSPPLGLLVVGAALACQRVRAKACGSGGAPQQDEGGDLRRKVLFFSRGRFLAA